MQAEQAYNQMAKAVRVRVQGASSVRTLDFSAWAAACARSFADPLPAWRTAACQLPCGRRPWIPECCLFAWQLRCCDRHAVAPCCWTP